MTVSTRDDHVVSQLRVEQREVTRRRIVDAVMALASEGWSTSTTGRDEPPTRPATTSPGPSAP